MKDFTHIFVNNAPNSIAIVCVNQAQWLAAKTQMYPSYQRQSDMAQFEAKAGTVLVLLGADGTIDDVYFGLGDETKADLAIMTMAKLHSALPTGVYHFETLPQHAELAMLALALQAYSFDRYKSKPTEHKVQFITPAGVDMDAVLAQARAIYRGRSLINTPANDLGTEELAAAVQEVGTQFGAKVTVHKGKGFETQFPLIHAVGKASPRPPLLVDLRWGQGNVGAPKVTIVGKGVVFDTGGLDIKPASGMLLMKKDMGGAATALACAEMIMAAGLKVQLRLLIPSAENSIAGNAFRPSDIYPSRKGLTVEIGDTDAEGRLLLADALALADEESPDYIFNFATLTGAARVAMGPEVMPFFTTDDALATQLYDAGVRLEDPLWRLPFWMGYDGWLKSSLADVHSTGTRSGGGVITAALFLKRFVEKTKVFTHFDVFGWVASASPAHPEGGEIFAARAVVDVVKGISEK